MTWLDRLRAQLGPGRNPAATGMSDADLDRLLAKVEVAPVEADLVDRIARAAMDQPQDLAGAAPVPRGWMPALPGWQAAALGAAGLVGLVIGWQTAVPGDDPLLSHPVAEMMVVDFDPAEGET